MQQRSERMEITHDMILREYAKIAFSNMANYYDMRGDVKPVCELTETEMAAISYFQTVNIAEPDGYKVGMVTKIKLHNKMSALDKIARHVGFYAGEVKGERLKEKGFEDQRESGSFKQEAFFETQESGGGNQDEDGLVVNGDGELVTEVSTEDTVMPVNNADTLESSSATAGKILTLSPLTDTVLPENDVVNAPKRRWGY